MQLVKAAQIAARELRIDGNYFAWRVLHRSNPSPERDTEGSLEQAKRIAIVRLDRIGDFVLFTPALAALYRAFPEADVALAGNPVWHDLANWLNENHIVEDMRLFDRFLPIAPKEMVHPPSFFRAARELSSFNLILSPTVSRTNAVDKLVAAAGPPTIGTTGELSNILPFHKKRNDRAYAQLVPVDSNRHATENQVTFARAVGGDLSPPCPRPKWTIPPQVALRIRKRLAERTDSDFDGPIVAISPFSALRLKEWHNENWYTVIREIAGLDPTTRFVLLGSPKDAHIHTRFVTELGKMPNVVNLTGKTNLIETTVMLRSSRLSISVDTAAAHIASAVGTPSIVILGGGHYGRFFPYTSPWSPHKNVCLTHPVDCYLCNWRCRFQPVSRPAPPCISGVAPEKVCDIAHTFLSH